MYLNELCTEFSKAEVLPCEYRYIFLFSFTRIDILTHFCFIGPCNRFWVNYLKNITRNGNRVMADYLPECSNVDGTFLLKQCSFIKRLCWCVDNNTGTMIAGTESESPNCFQHDHGSSESGAYNSTYNYIIALYLVIPYIAMHST